MMVILLFTKVIGLLTRAFLGYRFGLSKELDMFFVASTIPEIMSMILIFGAVSAAFIPVLSKTLVKKGEERFALVLSSALNITLVSFVVIAILCSIFALPLLELAIKITNPPVGFTPEELQMMANLMRFMFIPQIILGGSAVISSALQIKQRFLITQIAPLVYNIGGLIGVFILVPLMHGSIWGYVIGLFIGSILHLVVQIPVYKGLDIKYRPSFNYKLQEIREMFKLAVPRIIGLFADQIEVIISRFVAFGMIIGSVGAYNFALGIITIPFSLFGHTFSTAAFPFLSKDYADGNMERFRSTFIKTFQQILFFSLPVAVIVVVLRVPIVRLMYGFGGDTKFDWLATLMTAWVILFFGFRMVFESLAALLVKTFYSAHNTVIPVIVSFISVALGMTLAILLSNYFSHFSFFSLRQFTPDQFEWSYFFSSVDGPPAVGGIALGSSLSVVIDVVLLTFFVDRKLIKIFTADFVGPMLKKLIAAGLTFILIYFMYDRWNDIVDTAKTINIFIMTALNALLGLSIFFTIEAFFNDEEVMMVYRFLQRKIKILRE